MGSTAGRGLRVVMGGLIIAWSLISLTPPIAYGVAVLGAVPILTGLLNICVVGPLFGAPLGGAKARSIQS